MTHKIYTSYTIHNFAILTNR